MPQLAAVHSLHVQVEAAPVVERLFTDVTLERPIGLPLAPGVF